jgi:anti-sigma28 factor (negative regulator of flagellin synthesis)
MCSCKNKKVNSTSSTGVKRTNVVSTSSSSQPTTTRRDIRNMTNEEKVKLLKKILAQKA